MTFRQDVETPQDEPIPQDKHVAYFADDPPIPPLMRVRGGMWINHGWYWEFISVGPTDESWSR